MKVKEIKVRIQDKIFYAEFQGVDPVVTLVGELEDGEDIDDARAELTSAAMEQWTRVAITSLKAAGRRTGCARIRICTGG